MGYIAESELGVRIKMSKWRHHAIAIYTMFLEEKTAKIDDHENLMNKQSSRRGRGAPAISIIYGN
ncbi:hypothetical protein GX50_03353 [[Emmonsia] crescens]|uniref:Uncharacterized protein n=1 Tax=[Emmonsia] crescens TaxID=73230 RepID=A0A2B7ZBF3_9EURO|nr:hypothetical protein GX50_03353 [Emmonsia crescens]